MKFAVSQFTRRAPSLAALAGSFLIVAGWNWYHLAHRPPLRFIVISLLMWAGVLGSFYGGKQLYTHLVRRWRRHPFWQREFRNWLDELFFLVSLFFLVFFFRNELAALVYVGLVFWLVFWRLDRYLSRHPAAGPWRTVNQAVFAFAFFIFFSQAVFQYFSFRWYILDPAARFHNIVVFRSLAMSAFWLLGFTVAHGIYWRLRGIARYFLTALWSLGFIAILFFWMVNLSVLFFSGLQFSPVALEHLKSSEALLFNRAVSVPVLGFVALVIGFCLALKLVARSHRLASARYWYFYQAAVLFFSLVALAGFGSLNNTPERLVIKSFIDYYRGDSQAIALLPIVRQKLERFGLFYRPEQFFVAARTHVFSPSSTVPLLPKKFVNQPPNIVIVFLESFSARLTSVYNPRLPGLTPGLLAMAEDPSTTIFKKYYNASTPTITGLLSLLCSWLPSTGHEEIERGRRVQRLPLECLPDVLAARGFTASVYITAVPRTFANKGSIFESIGVDTILAQEELARIIPDPPLAWGYSDHQMFPVLWQKVQPAQRPFLMMLSTVDSHPPFNLAKDTRPYDNGQDFLLNSLHTTDDAFKQFWEQFRASPLAENTVLIAVADHAVFPAAYRRETLPLIESADTSYRTFYDENAFLMYIPETVLPKEVSVYASGVDFMPTLLHILGINQRNSFEGHSIFDDRPKYPSLLGMHELGLYVNQPNSAGGRKIEYNIPSQIQCPGEAVAPDPENLTLCEYLHFYRWKRQMFEQGRFWKE